MIVIGFIISTLVYLAGGRTTFWALTRADFPKSESWSCGIIASEYHHHNYNGCTRGRDLAKSRDRRVGLAYLWPVVLPVVLAFFIVTAVAVGTHKIITEPMRTPAERRERRLALERQVAAAEAEDEKAKALQAAAQTANRQPEASAKRRFPIFSTRQAEVVNGQVSSWECSAKNEGDPGLPPWDDTPEVR